MLDMHNWKFCFTSNNQTKIQESIFSSNAILQRHRVGMYKCMKDIQLLSISLVDFWHRYICWAFFLRVTNIFSFNEQCHLPCIVQNDDALRHPTLPQQKCLASKKNSIRSSYQKAIFGANDSSYQLQFDLLQIIHFCLTCH